MAPTLLSRRRVELLSVAILLAILFALGAAFLNRHLDRSFITYRYARHLSTGAGFAYNPPLPGERPPDGQPAGIVAPLYAAILALGALITPDFPLLGNLAGMVAIGLGGAVLYALAYPTDRVLALLTAGMYLASPLLWLTLGLEAALWVALGLLAIWLALREWGLGAALALALATLIRPEIVVLVIILIADSLLTGRPFRFAPSATYLGVVLFGLMAIVRNSGPLPGLAAAQPAQTSPDVIGMSVFAGMAAMGEALFALSPVWPVALILCAIGALHLKGERWALIVLGWAGLHVVSLASLRVAVYAWTFAPLVPALAALVALGVYGLAAYFDAPRGRWIAGGTATLLVVGALAHSFVKIIWTPSPRDAAWAALAPALVVETDRQVGKWLRDNTPPDAWVGTTRVGLLGYVSERPLLDYQGRLQPDLAQALARGDGGWWLAEYTPDYVVLHASEFEALGDYRPTADPWFTSTYDEATRFETPGEDVLVLRRVAEPLPLSRVLVGMVEYPNGLTLNGIATDFSLFPLEEGRMGRVRLEWVVEATIAQPQYVSLRIQNPQGTVATLAGWTMDFSTWPHRRLITTYHTLNLAPGLLPGVYGVEVGIGPGPTDLAWQPITHAKVPFGSETFIGALSGARTEFGDIALLGYRLARTEEGLEVLLMWQALRMPQADFDVLIQVRDAGGAIVAQLEVEPHQGAYPTSIWSAGEKVPDTYMLDIGGVGPGEYDVYVGLVGPDGDRVLTMDGQDAVFVGHLSIREEGEFP